MFFYSNGNMLEFVYNYSITPAYSDLVIMTTFFVLVKRPYIFL